MKARSRGENSKGPSEVLRADDEVNDKGRKVGKNFERLGVLRRGCDDATQLDHELVKLVEVPSGGVGGCGGTSNGHAARGETADGREGE